MSKQTVKKRIFLSNTWMIVVTLLIFLIINLFVVRVYTESIEHDFQISLEEKIDGDAVEELLEDYTIHKNEFLLLILADGVLCVAAMVVVSRIFTKKLVSHIMTPVELLTDGAEKIRKNDLTQELQYQGDSEFEEVCQTFNDMRKSILTEQERNQKYEKARTDMIAGISHDLRTPLTAIKGTIKALLDGVAATPERQTQFLETAYRRTGDMDVLLNQLFYLSKLETGNMPLELRPVNISEFLRQYVHAKQELFANETLEIQADVSACEDMVLADPEQLCRILDNLLENSRKYAQADPLRLHIACHPVKEGVLIRFSDNGVGVSEEKLPYIFDEFYRGDESRNQKDGNGLGLYIVKYLTEAMGGSVEAENADGFSVVMHLQKTEI